MSNNYPVALRYRRRILSEPSAGVADHSLASVIVLIEQLSGPNSRPDLTVSLAKDVKRHDCTIGYLLGNTAPGHSRGAA